MSTRWIMNTNYTKLILLCTLSLASEPAMARKAADKVTESPPLSTEEQQRVAELKQLAIDLAAHYCQAHIPTNAAPYDLEHDHPSSPLHWLAYVGDGNKYDLPPNIKKQLATVDYASDIPLLCKADVNLCKAGVNTATRKKGLTPLMLAASAGHTTVVQHLLSCPGIAVNAKTKQGATPLMFAASQGHVDVVELLLACTGVDINAKTEQGATPLMFAVYQGHEKVVELLLACTTIDLNAKTILEESALIFAAYQGHVGMVKKLLAHPAINVNITADYDTTPLMFAAFQGHEKVVELLLAHPEIQVTTKHTSYILKTKCPPTALMLAAYKGHVAIVELLLAHLPKINARTSQGDTALDCAIHSNHPAISKLLEDRGGKKRTELAREGLKRDVLYSLLVSLAITVCFDIVDSSKNTEQALIPKIAKNMCEKIGLSAFQSPWINRALSYGIVSGVASCAFLTGYSENPFRLIFPTLLLDIKDWELYAEQIPDIAKLDLVLY